MRGELLHPGSEVRITTTTEAWKDSSFLVLYVARFLNYLSKSVWAAPSYA